MTLPANIRTNVTVVFPARVQGAGYIGIVKANGVYTIRTDFTKLTALLAIADPTTKEFVIHDLNTGQYNRVTVALLAAAVASIVSTSGLTGAILNTYRIVTAAGDLSIVPTDQIILLNKTVGATTNILLPESSVRNGVPVTVKDYKGDAATNNIRYVLAGSDTIDGYDQATADANGSSKIDVNKGIKTLNPLASGGYFIANA